MQQKAQRGELVIEKVAEAVNTAFEIGADSLATVGEWRSFPTYTGTTVLFFLGVLMACGHLAQAFTLCVTLDGSGINSFIP